MCTYKHAGCDGTYVMLLLSLFRTVLCDSAGATVGIETNTEQALKTTAITDKPAFVEPFKPIEGPTVWYGEDLDVQVSISLSRQRLLTKIIPDCSGFSSPQTPILLPSSTASTNFHYFASHHNF